MNASLSISSAVSHRLNLIAVLDWGLGHASRSLALASRLRQMGEKVCWASAGQALEMIKRETKGEACYELPAYDIAYPTEQMAWNMAWQAPKIMKVIRSEHKIIQQIIRQSGATRLISDSRFGCYSSQIPSIFLSHQLRPIVPAPVQWLYRRWLRPFDAYWVPDEAGNKSLSGRLSLAKGLSPVEYIGVLSRLQSESEVDSLKEDTGHKASSFDIGILLSGPEPQRTKLERELLNLIRDIPGRHWLVRGLPNEEDIDAPAYVRVTSYADASQVYHLLTHSSLVVCRSGYSTLMDLKQVDHQQLLFVPTPGQTEQIYLAKLATQSGWARTAVQGQIEKTDLVL